MPSPSGDSQAAATLPPSEDSLNWRTLSGPSRKGAGPSLPFVCIFIFLIFLFGDLDGLLADLCRVTAEARSHDDATLRALVQEMLDVFAYAASVSDCTLETEVGTQYTGYRFEVQAEGDSLDCLSGQSCPQSTGRWPIDPVLIRRPEGTVLLAPFEAGPVERKRRAVFTAYFAAGKRPR